MEKTLIESSEDRMNAGVKYFSNIMQWLDAEGFIFNVADKYVEDYSGGFWDFFETKNGAFFMAPSGDETYKWSNPDNYSECEMSGEAIGIVACLYAFSHMSFKHRNNDSFGDQYHKLREAMYRHPESAKIIRAID
jgi:hypothetical protein